MEWLNQYILPGSILFGSVILGFIFDKIIFKFLQRFANRTKWEGDEIIIECIKGKAIFWSVLIGLYADILNSSLNPATTDSLLKIILVIFILSVTWVIAKIVVGLINLYSKKNASGFPSASIFTNIARVSVFVLGILVVLQSLGISITPLLTALGVGGLAVALALQDTLSNLFAGLQILASNQIRPGDYIKLSSGEEGTISDITWRNTTIKQLSNNCVIVPNSKLASVILINYTLDEKDLSFPVQLSTTYESDLSKVEAISLEVAKHILTTISGADPNFLPVVRFHTFSELKIDFAVVLRAKEFTAQFLMIHEFLKEIHRRFKEENIQITVQLKAFKFKD